MRTLDSLAESIDYGLTASAITLATGPRFLRITDIQDGQVNWTTVPSCRCTMQETSKYALQHGDIVFARTGATTGKSFLIEDPPADALFASYLIRVRPKPEIHSRYLSHFLTSPGYWRQIAKHSSGSTQPGVNATKLRSLEIRLPPLAEQRRIAAMLDKANGVRRKRRESLRLLDELLRSVFLEMFGDPVRNPKGWEVVELGKACTVQLGKMLSAKARVGSNPVPYLRNANVQWRSLDLSSILKMDFTDAELAKFALRPGDLLVCEGGEVGRCAIWTGQLPNCSFQKALHRVRPRDARLRMQFLQECIYLFANSGALADSTSQATIAHLTKVRLEKLRVPCPPQSEQQKFAEVYESISSARWQQENRFDQIEELFNSLAQRAFG